MLGEATS